MDNDVIRKMNRALGIGLALGVDDDQRFEQLRGEHERDAEAGERTGADRESEPAPEHPANEKTD